MDSRTTPSTMPGRHLPATSAHNLAGGEPKALSVREQQQRQSSQRTALPYHNWTTGEPFRWDILCHVMLLQHLRRQQIDEAHLECLLAMRSNHNDTTACACLDQATEAREAHKEALHTVSEEWGLGTTWM
jgi:hypothetical protein